MNKATMQMRSQKWQIDINPQQVAYPNNENSIFMVRNLDATNTIYLQFGSNAGLVADAWQVLAGEVFTLDPAAPRTGIWIWGQVAGIDNRLIMG
jgi:hypothetical protein